MGPCLQSSNHLERLKELETKSKKWYYKIKRNFTQYKLEVIDYEEKITAELLNISDEWARALL